MTRFCKQRDHYSCGPIALLNIDKFFGRRVTYKDLPRYRKRVQCKKTQWTTTQAISKILGRARRKTWPAAKRFLQSGCIVVQTKRIGHFYLMVTNGRGDIGIVNVYRNGHCAIHITPQRASQMLRHAFRTWYVSGPT